MISGWRGSDTFFLVCHFDLTLQLGMRIWCVTDRESSGTLNVLHSWCAFWLGHCSQWAFHGPLGSSLRPSSLGAGQDLAMLCWRAPPLYVVPLFSHRLAWDPGGFPGQRVRTVTFSRPLALPCLLGQQTLSLELCLLLYALPASDHLASDRPKPP